MDGFGHSEADLERGDNELMRRKEDRAMDAGPYWFQGAHMLQPKKRDRCQDFKPDLEAQLDCINCGQPWESHK